MAPVEYLLSCLNLLSNTLYKILRNGGDHEERDLVYLFSHASHSHKLNFSSFLMILTFFLISFFN